MSVSGDALGTQFVGLAKRARWAYPELVALAPVASFWATNRNDLLFRDLVPLCVGVLGATTLAHAGLFLLVKDKRPAAAAAAVFGVFVAAFGQVADLIGPGLGWLPLSPSTVNHLAILAAFGGFAVLGWKAARWHPRTDGDRAWIAFVVVLTAIGLPLAQVAIASAPGTGAGAPTPELRTQPAQPPDVWYIILDMYTGHEVLQRWTSYDNSPFLDGLASQGFTVLPNATTNYFATHLSLPSSLNMVSLEELSNQVGKRSTDTRPLQYLIADNAVERTFARAGYSTYLIADGTFPTIRSSSQFDHTTLCSSAPSGLGAHILKTTALRLVPARFENLVAGWLAPRSGAWTPGTAEATAVFHEGRIQCGFDAVDEVAHVPGPKFVMAHIVAPHPPFVLAGSDCHPTDTGVLSIDDFHGVLDKDPLVGYGAQAKCVDVLAAAAVQSILATSGPSAVIVIQGDHGRDWGSELPQTLAGLKQAGEVDANGVPTPDLVARLQDHSRILNAVRLPGHAVPENLTPVNTFRVILNALFDSRLPLQPNESYYLGAAEPYNPWRVTEWVKPGDAAPN